jgi:hypothetical protein
MKKVVALALVATLLTGCSAVEAKPEESPAPSIPVAVSDALDNCRIKDARTIKTQSNNVGFPHSKDIVPTQGEHEVILIPVDFEDAPGTQEFLDQQNEQMQKYIDWYAFFSNGAASAKVFTSDKWFRASKASSSYKVMRTKSHTKNVEAKLMDSIAQEFISLTGKTFDFSNTPGVFFIYPEENNIGIENSILGRGVNLKTPQGVKHMFYYGPGKYSYDLESKLDQPYSKFWTIWIHEILHSQGVALHAPGNGQGTGVGQQQELDDQSDAFDVWEMFLLDWLKDSQVFCKKLDSLTSETVEIQPLEISAAGYKTAIVAINDHEALVVESRRPVSWSSGWHDSNKGALVYRVDTSLDNDRSGEADGRDNGNDPAFSKWAFYLVPNGGKVGGFSRNNFTQMIMKVDDTVNYGGVTIKLVYSGDTDVVEITRD